MSTAGPLRRGAIRSSRWPALLAALLLAACEPTPTQAPSSASPAESQPAASSAAVSPEGSTGPSRNPGSTVRALGVTEPPRPTTSLEKIQADVAAGTLDVPTSYLYRAYAQVDDPQLPAKYLGESGEDAALDITLRQELPSLAPDIREKLMPYLVRPTDPLSIWNQETTAPPSGATGARSGSPARLAAHALPLALACVDGWIHDRVNSTIPVMLWSRCAFDPAAANARLEEARGYFLQVWLPETNLMGPPIGDRSIANDGEPDPPEGNDGLIDVYLVAGGPSVRDLTAPPGIYGKAVPTTPYEGPAGAKRSSGYMVIRPSLSGSLLKATIIHELFHVLQFAHNTFGSMDCPIARLSVGCSSLDQETHWFVEASAAWSEHEFAVDVRPAESGPWENWNSFRQTAKGLSMTDGHNEYWSYMWPLFMEQEWDAEIIGDTWRNLRAKVGWWEFQRTVDAQLSFEQRFDDFAVRVLNEELTPGDPINPRFRAPRLDPAFPLTTPLDPRLIEAVEEDLELPLNAPSTTYNYTITMNSLWSVYVPIELPPAAGIMRFEFAAFAPQIEVDALVQIDGVWERQELPTGETEWCLDNDKIEDAILVFSNHDQTPGVITRPWSIVVETGTCGVPVGTLAYSFLDTAPIASYPGGSVAIDATVQVRLKQNENIGDPFVAMYLNDGSTYGVHYASKILMPPAVDGCQASGTSTGTNGGPLALDSVTGGVRTDENGDRRLGVSISLPVTLQIDEFWCSLGSTTGTSETTVQYPPDCEGTATAATPTTETFVFDCDFQGSSQSWSVTGTLVLNR